MIAGDILAEVAELQIERPNEVIAGILDITDEKSWKLLVDAGVERFGRIDILINNAGVLRRVDLEHETAAAFEDLWRVNCLGAFLGMQAVLPHLRAAGGGAIVNTLSTAATSAWAGFGAYGSSKWAARGLTKVAALEFAGDNIRVNAVVPGPVLTPMVVTDEDPGVAERLARTPLGRAGLPSDIAELVLYLVSDASSFMTGAEIAIDGGQSAGIIAAR